MKRLNDLLMSIGQMSEKHFKNVDYRTDLKKLKHEADEAAESGDLEEFADCLIALLSAYRKAQGPDVSSLIDMAETKVIININRDWKMNADGTYSHIKTAQL